MGHWQDISSEFDDRLGELADLFLACREVFFEIADRDHWVPAPGSGAAHDASELPSPDPAISKSRGETGHRLIAEVLHTYLLTASGHLGGLASLYANREVLFSPPALIRAVMENCAHAVWVLGGDPDEPPEARLARAYLEEYLSALEAKKNAGRLHEKSHSKHVRARVYHKTLKLEILERFPGTDTHLLGEKDTVVNGQNLLSPEATVQWMYALTEDFGGTIRQRTALGIYGFLSNMTHPTLYPARERRTWADDPAAGHVTAHLRTDLGSTENEARAALGSFYNALNYVTSYFGWPTETLSGLDDKIKASMPTFFV